MEGGDGEAEDEIPVIMLVPFVMDIAMLLYYCPCLERDPSSLISLKYNCMHRHTI